ncbi:MAG: TonB-dependent receptor [Desulfobulbus sp.]|jgi:vitamin B12 transporter
MQLGLSFFLAMALFCLAIPLLAGAEESRSASLVFTRADIARMKVNRMADILNQAPGITAGDSSVSIHGSTKVKVLVDGRPINDPTSSHGTINWSVVNLESIERIEILPGRGGVRYGQDASGGVILIETSRGTAFSGQIRSYGGSEDTAFAEMCAQAQSGLWSAELSSQGQSSNGYVANNDTEKLRGGVGVSYGRDARHRVSLHADYLHEDKGLTGLPEYPTPHSRKKSETMLLAGRIMYEDLALSTFFNSGEEQHRDVSKQLAQDLQVDEFGQDASYTWQTGGWGDLALGASYRINQGDGSTFTRQQEESGALFATQVLRRNTSPWSLTLGLRANAYSAFDSGLNPEVKIEYRKPAWSLSAGYNRADNTPSFKQRFAHTSSTLPNPDLGMETADNWLAALSLTPTSSFSLRVSVFDNQIKDRITYLTDADGMGQYVNYGEVSYQGGDVAITWQPVTNLTVKSSYIYLDAEDDATGFKIPGKASHVVKGDLFWQATDKLLAVLSGKRSGKVYRNRDNTKEVAAYATFDLRAEYDFGNIALFAEIDNLANSTWYYADGLLGPPRTWLAGIRYRW